MLVKTTNAGRTGVQARVRWTLVMKVGSAGRLPLMVGDRLRLMELGRELFAGPLAERLFEELAGVAAGGSYEPSRLHGRLAGWADGDLDRLLVRGGSTQAAPPTVTVRRIEPSASCCSRTVWPWRLASSRAFSQV